MQPVWRGERAQKGRFKEFWQCDIDSIWRSESDIGVWYDIETILVLQKTLNIIFDYFGLQTDFVTKLNHIGLTKLRLAKIGIADISGLCALLDDYYKIDRQNFMIKLS
jgi:histidyl-tRNA synthetase